MSVLYLPYRSGLNLERVLKKNYNKQLFQVTAGKNTLEHN